MITMSKPSIGTRGANSIISLKALIETNPNNRLPPLRIQEDIGRKRAMNTSRQRTMIKPLSVTPRLLYHLLHIGNKLRRKPVLLKQVKVLPETR